MAIGTTAAILGAAAIGGGTALASGAMQSKAADKSAQAVQQATDKSDATNRYIFDTIRNDTAVQRGYGDAATRQIGALMGLSLPGQVGQAQPQMAGQGFGTGQYGNALRVSDGGYPGLDARMGGSLTSGVTGQTQNALSPTLGTGQVGQAQPVPSQSPTDWLRNTPGYQFNYDQGMRSLNTGLASQGRLFSGDAGREAIRYGSNYNDGIYNQERNALFNLAGMGQVSQGQSQQAGQNYANNSANLNMNNANARASSYQNSANAWTNALGGAAGAGMWALGKFGQ